MPGTRDEEQQPQTAAKSPKELAWSYFELLNQHRIEDAIELLDDEGSWWGLGPRTAVPMTTFKVSGAAIMRMMPMHFTLHNAIAEGDTVLLEHESVSPKLGGGTYNNRYCHVMVVRGAKILHVREYPDTKYAAEMLPAEAWDHEQGSWAKHYASYWHKDDE